MAIGRMVLELDGALRPRALMGEVLPPAREADGATSCRVMVRNGRRYLMLYTTPRTDSGELIGRES